MPIVRGKYVHKGTIQYEEMLAEIRQRIVSGESASSVSRAMGMGMQTVNWAVHRFSLGHLKIGNGGCRTRPKKISPDAFVGRKASVPFAVRKNFTGNVHRRFEQEANYTPSSPASEHIGSLPNGCESLLRARDEREVVYDNWVDGLATRSLIDWPAWCDARPFGTEFRVIPKSDDAARLAAEGTKV